MFLLQQGWGMLNQIENYLSEHHSSGIILSPRICERDQLERYLPQYKNVENTEIFFEPYFYEPRTDLGRVLSYPFFDNYDFETKKFKVDEFCRSVIEYQINDLELNNVILPGRFTNSFTEDWLNMHYQFAQISADYNENKIYATIALGPDIILNPDQFSSIVDEILNYPVYGIYFIFEHPTNEYFLNEDFLYVLLDAFLSISLSGKKIMVGYSTQQSLVLAASGVDSIASGNYRNVRSFDHLNTTDRDNENLRKGIWYFDGNTFGEYKIPSLDLAFRRNLRDHFGPVTTYCEDLLHSTRPTAIAWPEKYAFCHYLHLMHEYTQLIFSNDKSDRGNYLIEFLNKIKENNSNLNKAGFSFGDRGFNNHIVSTISALELIMNDRASDIKSLSM